MMGHFLSVKSMATYGSYPESNARSEKNVMRGQAKFFKVHQKDLYYIGGGEIFRFAVN